jgi:hypothetical protein
MRYAPDPNGGAEERLERVVRSLQGMALGVRQTRFPGCRQHVNCEVVENDAGAEVRLRTGDEAAEAVLRIERGGVTLRAISRVQPGSEVVTLIEDEFSIHLEDELRWGDAVFRSADVLASRLLEHAARRLAQVTDDRPAGAQPGVRVRTPTPDAIWAAGMLTDRLYGWRRGGSSTRTSTPLRPPRMRDG